MKTAEIDLDMLVCMVASIAVCHWQVWDAVEGDMVVDSVLEAVHTVVA